MTRTHLRWMALVVAIALGVPAEAAELRGVGFDSWEVPDGVPAGLPRDARPILRVRLNLQVTPAEGDELGTSFVLEPTIIPELRKVLEATDGHWRIVVALWQELPPQNILEPRALETWLASVTALADSTKGHDVVAWEICDVGMGGGTFETDAFLFKKAVTALKASTPDALVAWCAMDDERAAAPEEPGPTAEAIEASGVLPFIDAFALDTEMPVAQMRAILAARGPTVAIWEHSGSRRIEQESWSNWDLAVDAQARGVRVATWDPREDDLSRALAKLREAIPDEAEPLEGGASLVTFPPEAPLPMRPMIVPSDLSHRVVFGPAPPEIRKLGSAVIAQVDEEVVNPRLFDPLGKLETRLKPIRQASGRTALQLPLVDRALVLAWDRQALPDETQEHADVAGVRQPTLDEILARHAERRELRAHRVTHWTSDLTTTMRYQLGQSGRSIEVRIESRYYERADGLKEIENQRFFIDGAPYAPKKGQPPELPLMEPDKVTVVPLEIQLDKSYEYELRGKGERDGRPAWRIAFRPLDAKSDAWAGTAWIDAETFDLLATDLVQSGLEPPILGNQQLESYGAADGPDGEAWLVRRIDTRRTLTVLGNNIVVDMIMTFTNPVVNATEFDEQLAAARASDRQMLRETDEGLKYLHKTEDGERVPADASPKKFFFVAGARYDPSYETGAIPLVGVNWLNNDAWGKGIQVNAFLAGAINSLTISDPSLWGSKTNLSFDAFVPLIGHGDRVRGPVDIDESTEAAVREPSLGVTVGRPLGALAQVAFEARVSHESWSDTDDTDSSFVVPADTPVATAIGRFEFHAKGWDARVALERSERTEWERWGPVDGFGEPTMDTASGYWRWNGGIGRTFHVTTLQYLSARADFYGGDDLDRFSQYEFSAFGGPQIPGFEGSGIHFDEAGVARLTWGLSFFGKFGVDLTVGAARTRNEQLSAAEIADIGFHSDHVGLGLGGTMPGPWRTIVRFDLGAPVRSTDYEDVVGEVTAQVLFTKLLR